MAHHHITSQDIPENGEQIAPGKLAKIKRLSGLVGLVGVVLSLLFFIVSPSYSYSWLFAFAFFVTIALGGCFWTLLHNLSNSGWGTSVRRLFENLGFVFPFIMICAVPFLFPGVQKHLFEWMNHYGEAREATGTGFFEGKVAGFYGSDKVNAELNAKHLALIAGKSWYMNPVAWYARMFFYFIGLSFVIRHLRKLSVDQDTDPKPTTDRLFRARGFSAFGLPIFAITATFLAFDLFMALDFKWFSTMWGVYVFAGCALNSMAVLILTSLWLRKMGYLKNVVTKEHDHIMGKLLFAFTVFWAYISFSQFFLIWYANITEETSYFLLRNTGNWNLASLALVFGHFAIPFLFLLRSDVKKKPMFMVVVCCWILLMHALDMYHIIIPERAPSLSVMAGKDPELWYSGVWLLDILAFITIGAAFLFFYLRNLGSTNTYPNRDPRILESANVSN